MIGDFVSADFDAGDQVGVAEGALADQEERGRGRCAGAGFRGLGGVKMGCGPSSKERATRDGCADAVGEIWR